MSGLPDPAKIRIAPRKGPSEKHIEMAVCAHAKARGLLAYKFTSPNRRSVPDRIFLAPGGLVFFIEFKGPGKKPTEAQAREIRRLRALGHIVEIVDDVTAGQALINELLE